MGALFQDFLFCFTPIFVAMDPIGLLPVYMGLTEGMDRPARRKVILDACLTGLLVAAGFMLVGQPILDYLGIRIPDFLVAGGVVLFCFAIFDLISTRQDRVKVEGQVGAVPLGVPLMVGPGVLTAVLLLLSQSFSPWMVGLALAVCLVLAGLIYSMAPAVQKVLGPSGSRAVSRIIAVFLAAFAVMMVREGVIRMIAQAQQDLARLAAESS